MDKASINGSSDDDLKNLGLSARGDIAALRMFAKQSGTKEKERSEKIGRLKRWLEEPERKSTRQDNKRETLVFSFGWKHFQSGKGYVQKKKPQGGGVRKKALPKKASVDEVLQILKETFFPHGENMGLSLSDCTYFLGNYKGELINKLTENGKEIAFTPEKYKPVTGFTVPSIYLMTKETFPVSISDDDESSSEDFPTMSEIITSTPEQQDRHSTLIGSSEERQHFFNQLTEEVALSEVLDREKESKQKEEDKKKVDEQLRTEKEEKELFELSSRLQAKRAQQLKAEAPPDSDHTVIAVRHPSLGVKTRGFL